MSLITLEIPMIEKRPTVTNEGLTLIKEFEGLRLNSYQDAVGVWTIGYGHTRTAKRGMRINKQQAEDLLLEDLRRFEVGVSRALKVPVTWYEFDALVAFAFNAGLGAFRRSTLLRLLNKGVTKEQVAAQFERWVFAGGRKLAGLVRRRKAEQRLFLGVDVMEQVSRDEERATPTPVDGPDIDLPTLQPPFSDTAATRLLYLLTRGDITLSDDVKIMLAEPLSREQTLELVELVREEQQGAGIDVDSIAGGDTWQALFTTPLSPEKEVIEGTPDF
jgi:lysozyme